MAQVGVAGSFLLYTKSLGSSEAYSHQCALNTITKSLEKPSSYFGNMDFSHWEFYIRNQFSIEQPMLSLEHVQTLDNLYYFGSIVSAICVLI